jgi:hypothetical protein
LSFFSEVSFAILLTCPPVPALSRPPQAALTYADRVEGILAEGPAADGTPADPSTQAAEGLAFFRTIAPLVARASSDADANAILAAFEAPAAGIAEQARGWGGGKGEGAESVCAWFGRGADARTGEGEGRSPRQLHNSSCSAH